MIGWSGAPHGWDKAAVPWRQTIFLPRGAAGIERLQGMQVNLIPTMVEQMPRQPELSGDYELELEYTSAAVAGLQHCKIRLPFRVVLPAWWREEQAENLRVDAVSTEAEVLSPQILEFRARLLVQVRDNAETDVYRPDPAAAELLKEYEPIINRAESTDETVVKAELPPDLAELKSAALGRLQGLRPNGTQPAVFEAEKKVKEEVSTENMQNQVITEDVQEVVAVAESDEAISAAGEMPIAESLTETLAEVEDVVEIVAEAANDAPAEDSTEVITAEKYVPPVVVSAPAQKKVTAPVAPAPLPDDGTMYRLRFVRGEEGWQQI